MIFQKQFCVIPPSPYHVENYICTFWMAYSSMSESFFFSHLETIVRWREASSHFITARYDLKQHVNRQVAQNINTHRMNRGFLKEQTMINTVHPSGKLPQILVKMTQLCSIRQMLGTIFLHKVPPLLKRYFSDHPTVAERMTDEMSLE